MLRQEEKGRACAKALPEGALFLWLLQLRLTPATISFTWACQYLVVVQAWDFILDVRDLCLLISFAAIAEANVHFPSAPFWEACLKLKNTQLYYTLAWYLKALVLSSVLPC